ncbi:MAG: hypothetical protein CUN54_09820, partial [Phototrophicales bacterium]
MDKLFTTLIATPAGQLLLAGFFIVVIAVLIMVYRLNNTLNRLLDDREDADKRHDDQQKLWLEYQERADERNRNLMRELETIRAKHEADWKQKATALLGKIETGVVTIAGDLMTLNAEGSAPVRDIANNIETMQVNI